MNQNNIENNGRKDPKLAWQEKFATAGIEDKIGPFEYVLEWKVPPSSNSGYGEPILVDQFIDGKKVDVYRTNVGDGNEEHSVYLHVKE